MFALQVIDVLKLCALATIAYHDKYDFYHKFLNLQQAPQNSLSMVSVYYSLRFLLIS